MDNWEMVKGLQAVAAVHGLDHLIHIIKRHPVFCHFDTYGYSNADRLVEALVDWARENGKLRDLEEWVEEIAHVGKISPYQTLLSH